MKPVNLSTDLLRSFVAVSDHGGYTKAGAVLGRTQPAISLQMRRLEDLVGKKLFAHKGRRLALTADGSALATYARQILRLNDEAVARFGAAGLEGRISVGVPSDLGVGQLQNHLAQFIREHPDIALTIDTRLSSDLLDDLANDKLDIAVAVTSQRVSRYLANAWVEQPIWIVAKGAGLHRAPLLPLCVLSDKSELHRRMVAALDSASRPWRLAHSNCNLLAVLEAVRAGIGISAVPGHLRREYFDGFDAADGLPQLERMHVGLFYKHDRLSDAGLTLANRLHTGLDAIIAP